MNNELNEKSSRVDSNRTVYISLHRIILSERFTRVQYLSENTTLIVLNGPEKTAYIADNGSK